MPWNVPAFTTLPLILPKQPEKTARCNVDISRDGAGIINNERRGVVDIDTRGGNRAVHHGSAVSVEVHAIVYGKYIIHHKPAAVDVRCSGNGEIRIGDQRATTAEIKVS